MLIENKKQGVYNICSLPKGELSMKKLLAIALICFILTSCAGGSETPSSSKTASSNKENKPVSSQITSTIYPAKNEYKEWTYNITDVADRLTLGNRCPISQTAKGMVFDQAGANFTFKADCEGDITINMKSSASWNYRFRHYAVYIDGVRQERIQVEANVDASEYAVTVAKGLSRGVHEIKVCRSNPAEYSSETVVSIKMNGVLCEDKPAQKDLLIEFLGDSLTAGLGNLDFENGSYDSEYSDSTQTYAFFTAEAFDADFSSVCCGGLPFSFDKNEMSITDRYNRVSFTRNAGAHDFARPADVVVINLGTNDHSKLYDPNADTEMLAKAKELLKFVRLKNPNAKIVWAYGMATNPAKGLIQKALSDLGGEQAGLYFCDLPGNIAGEKGHPVVESHKNAAKVLIAFMKNKLGLKEVTK